MQDTTRVDAMIDADILAAIADRLGEALAPPPGRYRPVIVADAALGLIDDERTARLARFAEFRVDRERVVFDPGISTREARSAAFATMALTLRAEGALPAWRDELYAIAERFQSAPLFLLERGAARYFGFRTYAAHANGIVRRSGATKMWLARRSADKAVDPGLLDNLVGGGIAAGLGVAETLVKEAWEEAGIGTDLAARAHPAGFVHVRRAMFDGLQRETVFVHDLDLPEDFVPCNQDGEASEHRLVDLAEAARTIACSSGPNETTLDASLVVLDYLIRRGAIPADARACATLAALRRQSLPV